MILEEPNNNDDDVGDDDNIGDDDGIKIDKLSIFKSNTII